MKKIGIWLSVIVLSAPTLYGAAKDMSQLLGQENNQPQELSQGENMEPKIGITTKNRKEVCAILNTLLSHEYVLYTKTLNYHWNVQGIVFHDFHALFKEQYEKLFNIVDDVAERVRTLGEPSFGSLTEFHKGSSKIKEQPGVVPSAHNMIKNLLADHETIIQLIRSNLQKIADAYGDLGTNNFLTDIMEKHEKIAWMLRATAHK